MQPATLKHLPSPTAEAMVHSQKLLALIEDEIRQHGPISFARYMELALYAPGLGYYSAGSQKFGQAGDFVTAPEISSFFSRCLARQCQQVLANLKQGDLLELGAGSGVMAADILQELEATQTLPEHYYILEVSADLKQRQQQLLKEKIPQLFDRIIWLDSLTNFHMQGVIIANEVLDAMPIHKFKIDKGIKEYYVAIKNNELVWQLDQADPFLEKKIKSLGIELTEGYESEINLMLNAWITSLSDTLKQGLILLVDYGFMREEFYHPDRDRGTLMCHYRHHAHDDPLFLPGLQDITAHVDFTAVADAAEACALSVSGYTNQANFLLNCGLSELVQMSEDPSEQLRLSQQLKTLLMPSEMGEIFKAMALTRDLEIPLMGFNPTYT